METKTDATTAAAAAASVEPPAAEAPPAGPDANKETKTKKDGEVGIPHAFHQNLPRPFHFAPSSSSRPPSDDDDDDDEQEGQGPTTHRGDVGGSVPYVTIVAHRKARKIVDLAKSIRLTAAMFVASDDGVDEDDEGAEVSSSGRPGDTKGRSNGASDEDADDMDIEDGDDDEDDDDDDLDLDEGDGDQGWEDGDGSGLDPATSSSSSSAPGRRGRTRKAASLSSSRPRRDDDTLQGMIKKLSRLQAQMSGLEALKYGGITQDELCEMVLHLLRLVTCTIEYGNDNNHDARASPPTKEAGSAPEEADPVKLHFAKVGYVWRGQDEALDREGDGSNDFTSTDRRPHRRRRLDFALPTPAREVILLILLNILSNKGPLRSVSNAAIYPAASSSSDENDVPRTLLILSWKVLMRCLLRTAPYLDEHQSGNVTSDSHYRQSTVLRRTVQLVRDARHFFDQGVRPPTSSVLSKVEIDCTARQVWSLVEEDVLYHSHTHACYRGTILLYLFHPSRCSSDYYRRMMPVWFEAWTHIDRCPEYDFLYLALFCRARKHLDASYDWAPIRRRLLTLSQYWLQLPIGGASLDKSFPRFGNPRSRSCPSRLKVFTGSASSYEEGIDFVAKVVKLLVASVGINDSKDGGGGANVATTSEANEQLTVSDGTKDLLRFLSFATPYYNPINIGSWTFTLGAFLHYFAYELCSRVGSAAGMRSLRASHPEVADAMDAAQPGASQEIPPHEVVALMDALLPLCQQAIYSKNPHVGRAGEAALLYLVQIDPVRATPSFVDFATRALDETSVTMAHLAPSALSALTRLVQPALRADPIILFRRLPAILNLSLKGIDSNDQNKTIRTLILYRSLTSWLPIGGTPESWCDSEEDQLGEVNHSEEDGTMRLGTGLLDTIVSMRDCKEYIDAVERLPATSLMKVGALTGEESMESDVDMRRLYLDEGVSALSDWSIEFLERVFGLLRASGEREKAAKTSSGVATRHSNADLHQARNFSRVLQECVLQLFVSMNDDAHAVAVRSIVRFLEEETHPSAAKDASLLCQGAAAARTSTKSPGLDAIVPVLTDDFRHHSVKTSTYRIRCLAGAVRYAGGAVVAHRVALSRTLEYALSSGDRHLFKTGCKLLRHLLATLCEAYPIAADSRARVYRNSSQPLVFGKSGQLHGDPVRWHVPDESCVHFAADLLTKHVSSRLKALCAPDDGSVDHCKLLSSSDIPNLRRCLRVIRYSIRGGASLLLDEGLDPACDDIVSYEVASFRLLSLVSQEVKDELQRLRGRMCTFLVALSSIVASDTLYADGSGSIPESDPTRKVIPLISSDPKVCKETCDLALLLLTRRGASFRSQEARTIWKAQKQVAADFTLCAQVDRMTETLQSASRYGNLSTLLYKDGEDAGKSIPRRLLVARVQLFHASLQRNASFEVPRRLRRVEREAGRSRIVCFSVKPSLLESVRYLDGLLRGENHLPLDVYEGIIDGLFALCCHSNTQVRASAISVVDYAMTRFGWIVAPRVPRMLSGLSLHDDAMNGKSGVPSCAVLSEKLNQQGKRKRLAEAIKGVCSILSMTRAVRQMLGSWKMRYRLVETLCGTDHLVSLLPAEEMQKIIHYLQSVFSPFRSSFYVKPRTTASEVEYHTKSIEFVLDILSEKKSSDANGDEGEASENKKAAHWRKLLVASWFLLVFVDEGDIKSPLRSRIWSTCFHVLENNFGQPLQRVALGLFGKLLCLLDDGSELVELKAKMGSESFCIDLAKALVYDHKEDTSVGGGHDAQWSSGVETIIRDAGRLLAPRTLFPFQRTSQSLGAFKVPHSQFLEQLLITLDDVTAMTASQNLLTFAKELAAAPPSEDQRNQQITAAEIFAGVCGSLIRSPRINPDFWTALLLPFLEDGMSKTPFSLCGAYFDAIRYPLQFASPDTFFPLTSWLADKIKTTLWQPDGDLASNHDDPASTGHNGSSTQNTDAGFTAQSKWLYLFSAVLIEMDETESDEANFKTARFVQNLSATATPTKNEPMQTSIAGSLEASWRLVIESLLPLLLNALCHPFDSCRDHISRCLFRICYSHRKFSRVASSPSRSGSSVDLVAMTRLGKVSDAHDPGWAIVAKLSTLLQDQAHSHKDKMNSLITARRFIMHCVHLGEAKFEFSDYVIPLLSLAFESLDVSSEDTGDGTTVAMTSVALEESPESRSASPAPPADDSAARRALEAEVIKGFRGMISEMSVTAIISYGGVAAEMDVSRVLDGVSQACHHEKWQVRHAGINYLRCFQGAHKFLYLPDHAARTTQVVTDLLSDGRREVSSAAMAALTGILAASTSEEVARMVEAHAKVASSTRARRSRGRAVPKKVAGTASSSEDPAAPTTPASSVDENERKRLRDQQVSVFFLCATVLARPYDTPSYVPVALQAISPHSFERNAPLSVRDTVKKCCAEYKRTHMSDNWEEHRRMFSTEQLEAFEDVVSTPHYYA